MDRTGLWLTLILVLSLGLYAPSLINGYTYNDPHYARTVTPAGDPNPMVAELRPIGEYLTRPMNWGLPNNCRGYRPVTVFSYALVNALVPPLDGDGEDNAWAQHGVNLLLHGLAVLLVFALIRGCIGSRPALLGALIFGVHGLHSGAVAAVVGRGELLAFVAGGAGAWLYLRAMRPDRPRLWALAAAACGFALAFGSKESAVAWAGFTPLLAWARGWGWRDQLRRGLPTIAVPLVAFLALRQAVLIEHVHPRGTFWVAHDANPLYYLPFAERIINATCLLAVGLGKTLLPVHLSSNYGDGAFPVLRDVLDWRFLGAFLLLTGLALGAFWVRRKQPVLTLAVGGFFAFTFVTSNLALPIETNFAERTYYAAVLALALGAGWVVQRTPRNRWPLVTSLVVAWAAFNASTSFERARAWHDNERLFTADLRNQPDSIGLNIDLGDILLRQGDRSGAVRRYEAALAINPRSPRALAALAGVQPPEQAETLLRQALRSPYLVNGIEGRQVHWALGRLHERAGRPAAARRSFEKALACNPSMPGIRIHLLRQAHAVGDAERLRSLLDEGLALTPHERTFVLFRGLLEHLEGQPERAAATLGRVLPGLPMRSHVADAWLVHADALLQTGRPRDARRIAERFVRQTARFPGVREPCRTILRRTAAGARPR